MDDSSFSDCSLETFDVPADAVLDDLIFDGSFFDSLSRDDVKPYMDAEPDHYDAMVDADVQVAGAIDPFPVTDSYRDVIALVPSALTHRSRQNSQQYPDLVLMMKECRYVAERRRTRGVMTLRGLSVEMRRFSPPEDKPLLRHIFLICTILDHFLLLSYAYLGCKPQFVSKWYHVFGGTRLSRFSHFFWKWCRAQLLSLNSNYVFYTLGLIDCTETHAKAAIALLPSSLHTQEGFATWVYNQAANMEGGPLTRVPASVEKVATGEAKFTWKRNSLHFRNSTYANGSLTHSWVNFLDHLSRDTVNIAAALDLALHINDIANIVTLWTSGLKARALFTLFGYVYRNEPFKATSDHFLRVVWRETFALDPDHPSMLGRCMEGAAELFDKHVLGEVPRRPEEDLELEEDLADVIASFETSDPPEVVISGESLTDAYLLKKFFAVLSATQVPRILTLMPGFAKVYLEKVAAFTLTGSDGIHLMESVSEFVQALIDTCREFMHTLDFSVFLRAGGSHTFVARVNEFFKKQAKENRSVCIHQWIEEATALCDEGAVYVARQFVSHTVQKSYELLRTRLNTWISQVGAMANRKRKPFPLVLIGQPGNAKTSVMEDFARFAASRSSKYDLAERDAYGVIKELGGILYTAPMQDDHWNNCVDPFMVHANDLSGDGHSEHKFNVAALLQTAIDTVPFWTPQASIDDKIANSTIDPKIFAVSSNDNCWNFKPFGTNHAKLIRRYQKYTYIVEYPDKYYSVPPTNAHLGSLHDPEMEADPTIVKGLKYYRVKMYHEHGMIWFYRRKLVCVGYDNFLLHLKKEYLEHSSRTEDRVRPPTCNMSTPLGSHVGPCLPGCNFVAAMAEDLQPAPPPQSEAVAQTNVEDSPALLSTVDPQVEERDDASGQLMSADPELETIEEEEMFWKCIFSHNVSFPNQPIEVRPVVSEATGRIFRAMEHESKQWRKMFEKMLAMIPKALAALTTMYVSYKVASMAYRHLFASPAKPTGATGEKAGTGEAVLKPVPATFGTNFISRYGIKEAKAIEVPSPPGWTDLSRSLVWLSAASPTTSPKDFYPLVRANVVELEHSSGKSHGLYINPEVMIVNKHFIDHLGNGRLDIKAPGDVSVRVSCVNPRTHVIPNDDVVFVRTPLFPANNIIKHFATDIGARAKATIDLGQTYTEATYHPVVDRSKISLPVGAGFVYSSESTYPGYCGHPLVVEVNSHPMIVGIHAAKLKSGLCYAVKVSRKDVDSALVALASPVFPMVESLVFPNKVDNIAPLMQKSGLRSAPSGTPFDTLGTVSKVTGLKRSSYVPTKLNALATAQLREPRCIPDLASKGVKVGEKWLSPEVHKFTGMAYRPEHPYEPLLQLAVSDYLDGFPAPPRPLHPLDLQQALFGVLGDPLLKSVNMSTSSGIYEANGGKKSLIDPVTKTIDESFHETVSRLAHELETSVVVFHQKWARKDEIVTVEKNSKRKFRFFMISDMESLVLFRAFIAPLVAHMYRNKEFFECYGAFNPASPEFGRMYSRLRAKLYLMLCDMKHMDSSHRTVITKYVALFFRKAAQECGYNDAASLVCYNLVYGIVFNLCELNGDVFLMCEGMGSGVYITFILNCIVTSLLFRAAWFRDHTAPFRSGVTLATGGDDSATSTDDPNFNVYVVQEVARYFGYEIVPAVDKEGAAKKFDDWEDFVFLKRSPKEVVLSDCVVVVGVLDKDSIWKSLGWWDVTRDVSEEDRMSQALDAAQREMALWGPEDLEEFQKQVDGHYTYEKKNYDHIIQKYVEGKLYEQTPEQFLVEVWENAESVLPLPLRCHGGFKQMAYSPLWAAFGGGPAKILTCISLVTACAILCHFNGHTRALEMLAKTCILLFSIDGRVEIEPRALFDAGLPLVTSITESNSNVNNTFNATPDLDVKSTVTFRQELVRVSDTELKPTPLFHGFSVKNTNLERVVQSNTTYIITSTTTGVGEYFDLYASWAASPLILKQLAGYRAFRGRPCVRVTVAGNPMYYGKIRLVAQCGGGYDGQNVGYDNQELTNVIQAMMCPIGIDIDPSSAASYEMELPFVSCTGWYDRAFALNGSNFTPPTLAICYAIIAPLRTVENTVTNPSISLNFSYYMKDVEQAIPIVFSGESEIPSMLPPTATSAVTAVKLGLRTAGELALSGSKALQRLGFAKPNDVDVKTLGPILNGSGSGAPYAAPKLANDINQSTAPGPDAAGIGAEDDATIHKLLQHPSWIVSTDWNTSTTTTVIPVSPGYGSTTSQDTPMRLVNRMFKYWRGSIIYDVEVIANAFHRGSLCISYIPCTGTTYSTSLENPSRYASLVLDLAVTRKVSFTVPHTSLNYWQLTKDVVTASFGERQALLLITQQVKLTFPSGSKDTTVTILVTARAGPDFAVAVPDYSRLVAYAPTNVASATGLDSYESLIIERGESNLTEVKPFEEIPVLYNSDADAVQRIALGEKCDNLNMLLKRRFLAYTFNDTFLPAAGRVRYTMAVPPEPPCVNATVASTNLIGAARITPYMVLAPCFLGRRGGWRVTIQFDQMMPKLSELGTAYVTLWNPAGAAPLMGAFRAGGDYSTINAGMYEIYPLNSYRPVIEFEVPSNIRTNFRNSRNDYMGKGTNSLLDYNSQPPTPYVVLPTLAAPVTGTSDVISGYIHYAGADDFALFKFWWIPAFV